MEQKEESEKRQRPNVMPRGDGMKVDSQEGLLARGLGKGIRCWREPERLPAVTARGNTTNSNCYTRTHIFTLRHAQKRLLLTPPALSTLITLVILGFIIAVFSFRHDINWFCSETK